MICNTTCTLFVNTQAFLRKHSLWIRSVRYFDVLICLFSHVCFRGHSLLHAHNFSLFLVISVSRSRFSHVRAHYMCTCVCVCVRVYVCVHVFVLVCVRVYCVFVCVYISAENFMSEREVIKMLDILHQQKMHAESQAGVLQQKIMITLSVSLDSWTGSCQHPCPFCPSALRLSSATN